MTSFSRPWVQSLEIVGIHTSHRSDESERARQFLAERGMPSAQQSSAQSRATETVGDNGWRVRTVGGGSSSSAVYRIADLCRDQPHWDAVRLPAALRSFESFGNTVAVGRLPSPVPFILRIIVCGHGMVAVNVEITGPARTDERQDALPIDAAMFSAPPRTIALRPLKRGQHIGELGVATIEEHLAPVFGDEGIYFVVVTLNGIAEGKLPLFVRLEQ